MIVIMAGLPGTGKSTLARALVERRRGVVLDVVLDKDEIRRVLFPPGYLEYSPEQDDFCQRLMLDTAGFLLARRPDLKVFLDGRTFSRAYQIQSAVAAAERLQTPWRIIECVCSEQSARERLDASRASHPAQNRTYELYRKLQTEFEPIPTPKLVVDTDHSLDECVAAALGYLER